MSEKLPPLSPQLSVTEEFPPVSYDRWRARVEQDLKGASFEKKLLKPTYEGFSIPAVVSGEETPSLQDTSFPGAFPWTRGHRSQEDSTKGWDTRCEIRHPDPAVANQQALTSLERGAVSLEWTMDISASGENGVWAEHLADLEDALKEVRLDWAPMAFRGGHNAPILAAAVHALYNKRNLDGEAVSGALHLDPLGTLAASGSLPCSLATALRQMADVAAYTAQHAPAVRSVAVDTAAVHLGGCHEAQDLGVMLATGVAYLRAMEAAGMSLEDAAEQLLFVMSVDSQFFKGIAKLRAARQLWGRVLESCGLSEETASMTLQVKPSERVWTCRDPWVNLLRNTATTFVGAVAGADIVTPRSFDALLGQESELGQRIARNTSLLLQDESHLHRVADPAGGSWFLEKLTAELVTRGWEFFREIETEGGLAEVLQSGWLQERIAEVRSARLQKLNTRREPLTGVSEFANLDERLPTPPAFEKSALQQKRGLSMMAVCPPAQLLQELRESLDKGPAGSWTSALVAAVQRHSLKQLTSALQDEEPAEIAPIEGVRFAETFEAFRDRSDRWLAAHGQRPRVFLASLGTLAQHNARTTFTRNLLAAGGLEGVIADNAAQGYNTPEEAAAAFAESGLAVAILCSSNGMYETHAASTAGALVGAGAAQIWLAGRGGENAATWKEAGIHGYVFMGCDVVETLHAIWNHVEAIR